MHVFVTGGTGHAGSYVIPELIAAGHEVTGLARSDESAAAIDRLVHHATILEFNTASYRTRARPRASDLPAESTTANKAARNKDDPSD